MMAGALVIAASGKGGVGKSVFTAGCVRAFSNRGVKTLAIDADPAGGLQHLLGMDSDTATLAGVRDRMIQAAKDKMGAQEIAQSFDYMLMESLMETPRFDFLAMGHSRFKGCFCPVNRLLRDAVEALADNYQVVLIDAEAGLEQVYREVMRHVDDLALLMDGSHRSVRTAKELTRVAGDLGMTCKIGAVINRVGEEDPDPGDALAEAGIPLWGIIPEDGEVRKNDRKGKTIFELPDDSSFIKYVEMVVRERWSTSWEGMR